MSSTIEYYTEEITCPMCYTKIDVNYIREQSTTGGVLNAWAKKYVHCEYCGAEITEEHIEDYPYQRLKLAIREY